ncbi:MAG TPA: hypothetical protein G4O02_09500 [Caldilineae bacterium]|nr:hypothetical protein [Caldilineae bacterium]
MKKVAKFPCIEVIIIGLVLLFLASPILASTITFTFSDFAGYGFAPDPSPGQLDSDIWRIKGLSDGDGEFGGTHTDGDFARGISTGGEIPGGVYAFEVADQNVILGIQPTASDFNPGDITLKIINDTGDTITDVYVEYEIWYYNDQPRASALNFSYSTDDTNYTNIPSLDFTTPEDEDPSPSWQFVSRSTTISGMNIPPNGMLYLKWTGRDVGGQGYRDEYGIDNVTVQLQTTGGITAVDLSMLDAYSSVSHPPLLAGICLILAIAAIIGYRRT